MAGRRLTVLLGSSYKRLGIRLYSQAKGAPKTEKRQARAFVDFKRVKVVGGKGGDGCLSFLSLPKNEWAGPDGGDGGNGAHVIFQADGNKKSLNHVRSLYVGDPGKKGRNKYCHGKGAEHSFIKVPLGTLFRNEDQNLLCDLSNEGDIFVGARGGSGGKGNHFFLSNEERAPMTYEEGADGEERTLFLELRIIADVGLVGFPNAGKSTLLRALTRARPKVAAYPFTTLKPHVGIIEYDDHEQVAVADIPGLIEGAHQNQGLGISFLRHIERCRFLMYVLDLSVPEPWKQLTALCYELEQYQQGLSDRPNLVLANKIDLLSAQNNLEDLRNNLDLPVIAVSGKMGLHVEELRQHIRQKYDVNEK